MFNPCTHSHHHGHIHGVRTPLDRLEGCIALDVDENLHHLTGCHSDLKVTVEINNPFLIVEIAAGCRDYKDLQHSNLPHRISHVLNREGFAHQVRKSEYRYSEGAHYWSTLVQLSKEVHAPTCPPVKSKVPGNTGPLPPCVPHYPDLGCGNGHWELPKPHKHPHPCDHWEMPCHEHHHHHHHNHCHICGQNHGVHDFCELKHHHLHEKQKYYSWLQELYNDAMYCNDSKLKSHWSLYC